MRRVAAWLAAAWVVAARRRASRSGPALAFAAVLAGGAFLFGLGGGLGLDAALRRAVRAALLVLAATWLRAAAGAEGLREVSRRALAAAAPDSRRRPRPPRCSIGSSRRAGSRSRAGRSSDSSARRPSARCRSWTRCSLGGPRVRALRARRTGAARPLSAEPLDYAPDRVGACAPLARPRLGRRARRDQQVVEERRRAGAARAASGRAAAAAGSRGRRTRARPTARPAGSAVASSVRLAQPNRPAASSSPLTRTSLEAGRARVARQVAGRERVHVHHLLELVLLAAPCDVAVAVRRRAAGADQRPPQRRHRPARRASATTARRSP